MSMANAEKFLHGDITNLVLQAYYKVYNKIGFGFKKQLYLKALVKELQNLGCQFEINKVLEVFYEGEKMGDFEVDIFWTDKIIVQITDYQALRSQDLSRLRQQLKHCTAEVGLLLNFGETPEHKRVLKN